MISVLRVARLVNFQPKAAENAGRERQRQIPQQHLAAADADMQPKAAKPARGQGLSQGRGEIR